jgi:hypothetical protein
VWTAHLREGKPPALVRDGFSFWAFLFGPLWLALHRVWIPAILMLVASILIGRLTVPPVSTVLELGLMVLIGLSARDLQRWSLERRGYRLAYPIVARSEETALLRLLDARADLGARYLPPGVAAQRAVQGAAP